MQLSHRYQDIFYGNCNLTHIFEHSGKRHSAIICRYASDDGGVGAQQQTARGAMLPSAYVGQPSHAAAQALPTTSATPKCPVSSSR